MNAKMLNTISSKYVAESQLMKVNPKPSLVILVVSRSGQCGKRVVVGILYFLEKVTVFRDKFLPQMGTHSSCEYITLLI
jgi:hypothetical protein